MRGEERRGGLLVFERPHPPAPEERTERGTYTTPPGGGGREVRDEMPKIGGGGGRGA